MPRLLELVRELAAYEREPDAVVATEADLSEALFGPAPVASCHVADLDGRVVGLALWFVNFSTWRGKPGLYLEDIYVDPSARRLGAGRALMAALRDMALHRGYERMDWSVLDWNTDAQAFYRSLGAEPLSDWTTWRVELRRPESAPIARG